MSDIQIGVLKPEYLAKAARLSSMNKLHGQEANRLSSRANNPGAGPMRQEFLLQAKQHLTQVIGNVKSRANLPVKSTGSMSRRDNFDDQLSGLN